MKIFPQLRSADAKEMCHQGERAFTMVEIAIAIGVIGFALVAIIGILPTGMNVQKDNREDTVISQDAPYFLDAIRNGAPVTNNNLAVSAEGLDFLTNYVQSIKFTYYNNGVINGSLTTNITKFFSGVEIIGLLSTPQTNYGAPLFESNYFDVTAIVRALSGPATAQQSANLVESGMIPSMAFTYQMEVMVTPFNSFAPDTTNYVAYLLNADSNQWIIRSNRWLVANPFTGPITFPAPGPYIAPGVGALAYNLFDVRLRFSWPVIMNGANVVGVGPGRQTYRTLVSSPLSFALANGMPGWFFQPQSFTNVYPQGL
jgi:type II secretory pathway pseudopilin PulG